MIAAALAAEGVTSAQLVRVGQLDAAAGHLGPIPALLHIHVLGHPTVVELHEPAMEYLFSNFANFVATTVHFIKPYR